MKLSLLIMLSGTFYNNVSAEKIKDLPDNINSAYFSKLAEEDFAERISNLSGIVDITNDATVRFFIKDYVYKGRRSTELLLGRSLVLLPKIEQYLKLYGLPDELKYLPIIESNLISNVQSSAGAAGIWQLMPRTARGLGLRVDHIVDERKDVEKSTVAALTYLKRLYEQFGDWTIAIAAYNCGEGRVAKAIRYAKSTQFKNIKIYLPLETQKYIPRMLAAEYMMNYYREHDLNPTYKDYMLQFTKTVKIHKQLSFAQIAAMTGVSLKLIRQLNPAYRKEIIPANRNGSNLILPKISATTFLDYYKRYVS